MSTFLKGKLLEYSLRKIMHRCGFTSVRPDGLYIYERNPILYINGKGAAHDADVLMEPPIQMPFAYPTRILFECKAYNTTIKLPIVRNAFGLRQDINDFEIVTEATLTLRQNNRRADVAIHERKRHFYQVGIATLGTFTKPAIEFAANNKIPLFSLEQAFKNSNLAELINSIPNDIEAQFGEDNFKLLTDMLSSKDNQELRNENLIGLVADNEFLNGIVTELNRQADRIHVGVLESGEMIFITRDIEFNEGFDGEDILSNTKGRNYMARIHWERENRELWSLEFDNDVSVITYSFYLPFSIANSWAKYEEPKAAALNIKATQFSRIFVFSKSNDRQVPFNIITLDMPWLDDLRRQGEAQ